MSYLKTFSVFAKRRWLVVLFTLGCLFAQVWPRPIFGDTQRVQVELFTTNPSSKMMVLLDKYPGVARVQRLDLNQLKQSMGDLYGSQTDLSGQYFSLELVDRNAHSSLKAFLSSTLGSSSVIFSGLKDLEYSQSVQSDLWVFAMFILGLVLSTGFLCWDYSKLLKAMAPYRSRSFRRLELLAPFVLMGITLVGIQFGFPETYLAPALGVLGVVSMLGVVRI